MQSGPDFPGKMGGGLARISLVLGWLINMYEVLYKR